MAEQLDDDVTSMSGLLPEDTYPATVIDFWMVRKRNDDFQNQNGGEISEVKAIVFTYALRLPNGTVTTVDTEPINFQSFKATKLNEKSGGVKYLCGLLGIGVNPMEMTDKIAAEYGGKARCVASLYNDKGVGISGSLAVRHITGKKSKYLDISKPGCFTPSNKLMVIEPIAIPEGYETIEARWIRDRKVMVRNAGTENEQLVVPSIAERKAIFEALQRQRDAQGNADVAGAEMDSDAGDGEEAAQFDL